MKTGPHKNPIVRGRTVPIARLMSKLLLLDFLPTAFGEGVLWLLDEIIVTNNKEKNKGKLCFGDL